MSRGEGASGSSLSSSQQSRSQAAKVGSGTCASAALVFAMVASLDPRRHGDQRRPLRRLAQPTAAGARSASGARARGGGTVSYAFATEYLFGGAVRPPLRGLENPL